MSPPDENSDSAEIYVEVRYWFVNFIDSVSWRLLTIFFLSRHRGALSVWQHFSSSFLSPWLYHTPMHAHTLVTIWNTHKHTSGKKQNLVNALLFIFPFIWQTLMYLYPYPSLLSRYVFLWTAIKQTLPLSSQNIYIHIFALVHNN